MNIVKFKPKPTKAKAARFIDEPLPPKAKIGVEWYRWTDLKVGGPALFIPGQRLGDVRKTANAAAERHGMQFEVRAIVIDGVPGAGIWRIM